MSYTPTNWQTGDTVTAELLNKMEGGIENANEPFIVTVSDSRIPDKSYAEIVAAFEADKEVQLVYSRHVYFLSSVDPSGVSFSYLDQAQTFASVIKIDSGGQLYTTSKFFMPPVSGADNGKGLVVKNGAWVKGFPEPFIVTLTPLEQDFSGTMDKTPQEITNAYNAGQDIEFDIPSLFVKCKAMEFAVTGGVIQAGAIVTYRTGGSHLLIEILTDVTDPAYVTHIYSLTPTS